MSYSWCRNRVASRPRAGAKGGRRQPALPDCGGAAPEASLAQGQPCVAVGGDDFFCGFPSSS